MSSVISYMKALTTNILNDTYGKDDVEELLSSVHQVKTIFAKMNKKTNKYKNKYFEIKRKYEDFKNKVQSDAEQYEADKIEYVEVDHLLDEFTK